MSNEQINWKPIEKIVFRFFFTFFILLILPLDPKFFSSFFTEGVDFFFYLFAWANYAPTFISQEASIQIIDLLFVSAISIIITTFWSWKQKEVKNYNNLYQLLRVVLRYKLGAIFLVYAFIKIFPL